MTTTRALAIVISVTLTTFVGAGPAAAGDAALASGSRVRVLAPAISEEPIVGQLVGSDEATLTVRRSKGGLLSLGWPFRRTGGETLRLPRESVTRFERSVRPSRKKLGETVGELVGLAVGIVIVERAKTGGQDAVCTGCVVVAGVIAAPFALIGAAIAPGDRWVAGDPRQVRVGFTRAPGGGVDVRVSLAF